MLKTRDVLSAVIVTCEKYLQSAQEAQKRLETYGFGKLNFILGDEKSKNMYFKNRNFTAACEFIVKKNLKHCLLFEEDVVLLNTENDLKIFDVVYQWCINHESMWEIVNFGGISITPIFPIHKHLGYARCVLGSSLLISQKYAKKFLDLIKTDGCWTGFDSHIAQTCQKQLKCLPSIFTQETTPVSAQFVKIEPFYRLHTNLDAFSIVWSYSIFIGSFCFLCGKNFKWLIFFWI